MCCSITNPPSLLYNVANIQSSFSKPGFRITQVFHGALLGDFLKHFVNKLQNTCNEYNITSGVRSVLARLIIACFDFLLFDIISDVDL